MDKLIIGDIVKKAKIVNKKNNNKRKNNRIYLFGLLFCFVFFSYYEINNGSFFSGYIKDFAFSQFKIIKSKEFIDTINSELKSENDELKSLLKLETSLSSFSPVYATVINRNFDYWFDYFTINKGRSSGIEEEMSVVDSFGLVGSVESVFSNTSIVKLITNISKYNNISVYINNNLRINKIVSVVDNQLLIKGVNKYLNIKIGDEVVTNGLSEKFPSGILVGKVSSIIDNDIDNTLIVEPVAKLDNIRFVAVLKRR